MDELLSLPDSWRANLAATPKEVIFAVTGTVTFLLLVTIAKKPRTALRWIAASGALVLGVLAGGIGARTGRWAERNDQRFVALVVAAAGLLLVATIRLMRRARKHRTDRRLVDGVRDEPQKLVVLALAPELSVRARMRAVHALDDAFSLDTVARRSRTEKVKRRAKRRLEELRRRPEDASGATDVREAQPDRAHPFRHDEPDDQETDELLPENYYLPPEER
jgi:hypothetical protein